LDEKERKRHLLKGFQEGYERVSFHYDSRALCPEITVRALLKRRGAVFTDLVGTVCEGKKEAGKGNVYLHPSEWWDQAKNVSDPNVEGTFSLLTLLRNEFIG
jgi:hypothetical protein